MLSVSVSEKTLTTTIVRFIARFDDREILLIVENKNYVDSSVAKNLQKNPIVVGLFVVVRRLSCIKKFWPQNVLCGPSI